MLANALLPLAARHLGSYLELGSAAATECRGALARRMTLVLASLLTGTVGLLALWAGGLMLVWSSPWRMPYVAISGVLLASVAAWLLWKALSIASAGPSSGALRSELHKDMELFQRWKNTLQ